MILFTLIHEFYKLCIRLYVNHRDSDKQVALRYLKKSLTPDQQKFIDEKFFDKENNKYHQFAKIERLDGRGKELERNKVVEITDANIDIYQHSYNLLSYSLEFFNQKKENKK